MELKKGFTMGLRTFFKEHAFENRKLREKVSDLQYQLKRNTESLLMANRRIKAMRFILAQIAEQADDIDTDMDLLTDDAWRRKYESRKE